MKKFYFILFLIASISLYYIDPSLKSLSYFAFPIVLIAALIKDSVSKLTYNLVFWGSLVLALLIIGVSRGLIKIY